eukprot:9385851-Alexandrium_andersonii.AAC.1
MRPSSTSPGRGSRPRRAHGCPGGSRPLSAEAGRRLAQELPDVAGDSPMWGSAHQLMLGVPEALDRRGQVILGFGEPGCQEPATRREPLESVFYPKAGRADS